MESFEVVIVGAGIWGLCVAQTFLAVDPSMSLLIIDSKQSLGGVWATEQLYPRLRTNNLQGFYEFSNLSLIDAGVGVTPRGHMSGTAIHAYLEKFAAHFDLIRRLRLGTLVSRAVENSNNNQMESGWQLELRKTENTTHIAVSHIFCRKLVLATGQASAPYTPSFQGLSLFNKPFIHSVDLGKAASSLISDTSVRNVTVVGGSKSAHDAVYIFATAGKHVNWIIHAKDHGRGAVPMGKAFSPVGPWTVWVEGLLMYRPLTWFGAAPWSRGDGFGWIRWLLHSTKLGNNLVRGFFAGMSEDMVQQSGVLNDEKTKVLSPSETMLWYGTQASSLNYDTDLYELVSNDKVSVILGNINRLEDDRIHLDEGVDIDTDALVFATGYDFSATVPLEPASKRVGWGVPVESSEDSMYSDLDAHSDEQILSRFPLLRNSPVKPERRPPLSPWRLWRFLAPPSQVSTGQRRNLIFLNAITAYQTFVKCELTSLWAYAYLYDRLAVPSPSEEETKREVSLWTRFGKWRAPYGMQGKLADFMFDAMPYYDLLLRDLGLQSWRKGWGIFGEIFGGWYELKDYKGVVQEWIALQAQGSAVDKKRQ